MAPVRRAAANFWGPTRDRPGSLAANLIARSLAMRALLDDIDRYASCDLPVLITGEVGTGLRYIGQVLHERWCEGNQPFMTVSCGSASIHAELFGAGDQAVGLLDRMGRGTLMLEDVDSLPAVTQAALLRRLKTTDLSTHRQEGPLHGIRLVSSVTTGERSNIAVTLSPPLYYRLGTLPLHVPPLRQRVEDIPMMADHFLQQANRRLGRRVRGFTAAGLAALQEHSWPGNASELRSTIERGVVLCHGEYIQLTDLHLELNIPAAAPQKLTRPVPGSGDEFTMMVETLRSTQFNLTRAAKQLKVSRVTLYRMLRRHGLQLRQECVVQKDRSTEGAKRNPP